MNRKISLLSSLFFVCSILTAHSQKVFDTHVHGSPNPGKQMAGLFSAQVYKAALSTSWDLQSTYKSNSDLTFLQGLMLPCPDGKVPYSGQFCFPDKKDFPDLNWVEKQIKEKRIHFIGEVLSQYYGISPSDEKLFPYYQLAERYGIPVGIHTGLAGPNHGSRDFKVSLGSPVLLEDLLIKFPKLKVWIMHSGVPFLDDTMAMMGYYWNVYADISAISNPDIFPPADFRSIMKRLIDAGLVDRLMFGSDNGDINKIINNVEALDFLTKEQKEKIFFRNAETFFASAAK